MGGRLAWPWQLILALGVPAGGHLNAPDDFDFILLWVAYPLTFFSGRVVATSPFLPLRHATSFSFLSLFAQSRSKDRSTSGKEVLSPPPVL